MATQSTAIVFLRETHPARLPNPQSMQWRSSNIRAAKDLECFLQGIDLCLPCRNALIPCHAPIDALGYQSVMVALRSQELVLSGLEIRRLLLHLRFGRGLVSLTHLNFPCLCRLAPLAVSHESLICLCRCGLCCMCFCLQSCKIRGDHFKQTQNSILRLVLLALLCLAECLHVLLVPLVNLSFEVRVRQGIPFIGAHLHTSFQAPSPWRWSPLLKESCGCECFGIVILQNCSGSSNSSLRCLGVLHCRSICCLLVCS